MKASETCLIVGRNSGLAFMHEIASFAVETTMLVTWFVGSGRRWSITSFSNISWLIGTDDEDEDSDAAGDDKLEMRSPGCLPITISIVTTPKL